jgi:Suppressor of fused protein (SUFU)
VLRAVGVTAAELRFAEGHGVEALLPLLEKGGALARTDVHRGSVALPSARATGATAKAKKGPTAR